ncbi:hypothetical protein Tco_1143961 [Tanacetum coccineum]
MRWQSFSCSNSGSMRCGKSGSSSTFRSRIMRYERICVHHIIEDTVPSTTEEKIAKARKYTSARRGNEATKRTQKALLKQEYENINASSSKSLDSIFNQLQKSYVRIGRNGSKGNMALLSRMAKKGSIKTWKDRSSLMGKHQGVKTTEIGIKVAHQGSIRIEDALKRQCETIRCSPINSKENTNDSLKQQQKTNSSSVKSPLKVDKDWKEKFFCPANQVREEELVKLE